MNRATEPTDDSLHKKLSRATSRNERADTPLDDQTAEWRDTWLEFARCLEADVPKHNTLVHSMPERSMPERSLQEPSGHRSYPRATETVRRSGSPQVSLQSARASKAFGWQTLIALAATLMILASAGYLARRTPPAGPALAHPTPSVENVTGAPQLADHPGGSTHSLAVEHDTDGPRGPNGPSSTDNLVAWNDTLDQRLNAFRQQMIVTVDRRPVVDTWQGVASQYARQLREELDDDSTL